MADVFIGVGSNINPEENLPKALELLKEAVHVRAVSAHFRTAPLAGRTEQDDYVNGVWKIETDTPPDLLKEEVLRPIESACGRVRTEDSYASRPVDLDVILWGDLIVPGKIPDPDLYTRNFLAFPLLELEPEIFLPGEDVPFSEQVALLTPPMHVDVHLTETLRALMK